MTLVLLACLPLLAAVGLALSKLSARIESSSAEAYAQAQDLAQQAMMQVRHCNALLTCARNAPIRLVNKWLCSAAVGKAVAAWTLLDSPARDTAVTASQCGIKKQPNDQTRFRALKQQHTSCTEVQCAQHQTVFVPYVVCLCRSVLWQPLAWSRSQWTSMTKLWSCLRR
jgi:hypothetical protein